MKKKLAMLMASLFLVMGTAWAQVSALGDLDNSKAYWLKNANGLGYAIWKSGTNLTLSGATAKGSNANDSQYANFSGAFNGAEEGSNWQIIAYESMYFLYNVGAKKFAVTQSGATYLDDIPTPISVEEVSVGSQTFAFNSTGGNKDYMCAAQHLNPPVQYWVKGDAGSAWQIIENTETASLQGLLVGATKVEEYFSTQVKLTIQYKFTGTNEILYTTEVMATKGEQYTVEAPYFTSVASVTIPGSIGGQTFTVPNTATTITVALNNDFPYETTTIENGEFPADAAWYVMRQNSTQGDTRSWKYADGLSTEAVTEYTDNHLWCFVGNPFDLKIYSKVAGASKSLSSSTQPASMMEGATGWVVVKSDNEKSFAGKNPFCLQRKNVSGSYLNGYSFGYWTAKDGGSTIKGDRAYSLTVKYTCGNEDLTAHNVNKVVIADENYSIEPLDGYNIVSCTVNGQAVEAVDGAYAVTVNAATEVVVTLESTIEPTNLYALQSPTGTYFNFTAVVPEPGAAMTYASFQEEPSFLYKVAENNSYYFESMSIPGEYIGVGPSNVYWILAKDNKALWNISAEDANGYVTISRSANANYRLGHDGNTNAGTGIFTNVGNTCFGWQLVPAYPITIIYKNSNDEVLETVKAATIAGTEYSFTVDTKGCTLVSCVADKGDAQVVDGTCTIAAVNGATTVTVTLEEPEVPVVFNPTLDKAYALKVKGQELYLNIRTLGINDPNVSGSNNISLSARPFAAIYFEAGSTEGTWKMKNVNGKYVGLYPEKNWDAVIGDAAHDWTIVLENGVVTIAREAGKFVNANDGQVAAGNPLYCDKGTPLQFELFDYDDVNFVTGTGTRNGDDGVGGQGTIQVKEIHEEGLTKIPLGAGWRLTMEVESDGASYNKWGSSILAVGSNAFPEKQGYKGFQLYLQSATNGDGKLDAVFGGGDHIIDNVSYQDDFSLVVEYDGSSKITFTTVNEQGNEATNVLSGSLPEIDVFSYGLPTGINIKSAAIQVFDIMYTFHVGTTPEGEDITITYDGEAVEADQIFYGNELDLLKFAATEIEGYTWAVVADKAANTLTLNYTQAEVADLQAVKDLVNRIGGEGTADKFMFVHTPWLNSKQETFVLGAQDGKIRIEGSTISAITTGIGWYLNNVAHINIAWNSLNEKTVAVKENGAAYADLSNLPLPFQTETHTSDAKYRYYLNTCTFGYSMTSWTWTRWQQEIDWMALHGINMPLQLVGLEEVWRTFLIKCGYSETDAKAFVAGPAFIAWWAMNNLQGWGGTDPGTKSGGTWAGAGGVQDDAWYARQKKLAKQIVDAQRGLGMQPVLPGWSGMVPTNFADKTGYTTRGNGGNWAGDFVRPLLLNVSNANYAEIAADYYECLEEVMGESQYYSMDPFHEGGGAGTMEDYEALYAAMEVAKPGSQWVIQQWQWSATQKYSLSAVPAGRLIVLDLFSDGSPAFDGYNGYAPQEAVFCAIPNFGGRSGLMGRLQNVTDNYFTFKGKYASIKGIGTAPEAIEQTPVAYDLIYQLPWMNGEKPSVEEWVNNYSIARYGKDNAVVKEAWSLLRQGPLNYGADGIQGPVEDVWAARPNLDAKAASYWGKTLNNGTASTTYTKERRQMLIDAVYKLIDQEDELALENGSVYKSNYMYDLVEFGGAVMADYAYDLLLGIRDAKNAGNTALYEARRDAFLQLILDMDAFRGTNLNFRLGKWTQEARAAAAEVEGATTATPDWYEYNNARTILSTWSSPNTNLTDYSYRSWQGLLKDYYYPRWKHYFDNNCTGAEYGYFEWNWAHGMKHEVGQTAVSNVPLAPGEAGHTDSYTREPEGNTVEEAVKMLGKYIIPIKYNNGTTYYAYRTFTYDLAGKATVTVPAGATVDFTQFFNVPADATVTGTFLNGVQSAPICAVPVTSTEGTSYTGTITLTDGTVLSNFTVEVETGLLVAGYYHINWQKSETENQSMFIGYNEVTADANAVGYKMLAEGQYTTEAAADKVFALVPQGNGFAISAQGKYLQYPNFNAWKHVMFSDNAGEAGVYLFEEVEGLAGVFNIRGEGEDDGDWVHNNYFEVYDINDEGKYIIGNNPSTKVSPFTLTPVNSYAVAAGKTALCLPFNVLLPEGVVAYDIVEATEETLESEEGLLVEIAAAGDILKAGTPVILVADEDASLTIVMGNSGAKTSLDGSLLEGNFVKQTLTMEATKKFVLKEGKFEALTVATEMPANSCWVVTTIEDENADIEEGHIIIDGWEFTYTDENNPGFITLLDYVQEGDKDLVIGSEYFVNGVKKTVVAISPDFLHGNETLESVTLPATMTNLGFREIEPMFEGSYAGKEGNYGVFNGSTLVEGQGYNETYNFPENEDSDPVGPWVVDGSFAWKLTLDVTIDPTKSTSFNNYGSAIVSTQDNSLADYYDDYMQIYLWKDLQHIVVKIDNNDDRYMYTLPELDAEGNETGNLVKHTHFKFELEHDGAGGYQVVIYYDDGRAKMYNISAGQGTLKPFSKLTYSLPEGISVNVKFEKLISHGLFVDCTNLTEINVDPANPTFKSCDHGVLYDKNGFYVMRIPEGGGHHHEEEPGTPAHFDIPSKVVKLYPGSIHGVTADIVLHSNPQIGVVAGHEHAVENAKFYLSLDDFDATIAVGETGYGGARDFISTNNNTYVSANYKRAPLGRDAEGNAKFGTIVLPFVATNWKNKYDFFELTAADATSLHFSPVYELKPNTAYLYKLKDGVEPNDDEVMTMKDGLDVFKTDEEADPFTVQTHAKYDPNDETPGGFRALGAYVNHYIETKNYTKSSYYVFSASNQVFNRVTKKLNYRPYRALFVVTPEAESQVAPARLNLYITRSDGSTTEITPEQVEGMAAPEYYDLMGRRVVNPISGGIYIVNGRKVVVE